MSKIFPMTVPGPHGTTMQSAIYSTAWTQLDDGHWTNISWYVLGLHPTEIERRKIFVHHLNGNPNDHRIENLKIIEQE